MVNGRRSRETREIRRKAWYFLSFEKLSSRRRIKEVSTKELREKLQKYAEERGTTVERLLEPISMNNLRRFNRLSKPRQKEESKKLKKKIEDYGVAYRDVPVSPKTYEERLVLSKRLEELENAGELEARPFIREEQFETIEIGYETLGEDNKARRFRSDINNLIRDRKYKEAKKLIDKSLNEIEKLQKPSWAEMRAERRVAKEPRKAAERAVKEAQRAERRAAKKTRRAEKEVKRAERKARKVAGEGFFVGSMDAARRLRQRKAEERRAARGEEVEEEEKKKKAVLTAGGSVTTPTFETEGIFKFIIILIIIAAFIAMISSIF